MGKALVFLVLAAIATALPAQQMFKCKQADGTISYQQLPCAESAQRQELNIHAPPPPTPVQTRRMVQAFDPATGVPTFAWIDGPAEPSGDFYITREFRTVVDPQRMVLVRLESDFFMVAVSTQEQISELNL